MRVLSSKFSSSRGSSSNNATTNSNISNRIMDNPNVTISDLFVGVRESLKKYERRQKQQQKKAQQKRRQQQQQKQMQLFSSQLNNKKPDAAVMSSSSSSSAVADVGGDATTSSAAAASAKTPFSIGSSSIPTPTLLCRQGSTDEPIVPQPTMSCSPSRPPYSKRVSSDLTTSGTTTATRRMSSSMLWTAAFDTGASERSTSNLLDQSSSSLFNQSSSNFTFFDTSTPAEGKEEEEVPSCSDDEEEEDNDISSTLPPSPPLSSKSSPTEYIPLCEQRRRAEVEASIRRTLASLMPNTNSNNVGTFGSTSNKFIKPLEWNKPSFTFGGSNSEGKKRKSLQEEDETASTQAVASAVAPVTGSSSCSSNNTHYSGLDTMPPRSLNSASNNITPCTSSTSMMLGGYSSTFNNGSMLPSTMSLSSNPYQLPSYNTYNYKRTWTKEEVDGLVEFADKWITPDMKNKKRRLG